MLAPRGFAFLAALFLMTLAKLKRMLSESFMRTDLEHNYTDWINRALLKIQEDEDWSPMRERPSVIIESGTSSVLVPRFKALTAEPRPIHVRRPGEREAFPCELLSFEKAKSYRSTTYFPPNMVTAYAPRSGVPVFFEYSGEDRMLCITAIAAENLEFLVSCYMFQPALEADEDGNFLTRQYPDMVEAKALSIAFRRVNELELSAAYEAAYQQFLREARNADYRRKNQGRPIRMGG